MNTIGYSPDILEKNEILNKKFCDKQTACDELMYILKERAELEEYYSRNLEKQAEQLRKLIPGKDNIKHITISLQQIFTIQAEQSKTFAQSIKTSVLSEFSQFIQKQSEEVKNVSMVGRSYQISLKQKMDKFDQFRSQYMEISEELQKQSQNKQNISETLYSQKKNVEKEMQTYIQHYNQYIDSYFVDYAKLTDSFKQLETDRREKIRDLVMKFFVYSISLISNLQYDVGRLSKQIETVNLTEDIENMFKDKINDQHKNKRLLSKVNFENYKYYMDYSLQKQGQNVQSVIQQSQQFLPGFDQNNDNQQKKQPQYQQQLEQKQEITNQQNKLHQHQQKRKSNLQQKQNQNQQQQQNQGFSFSWMKNMFGDSSYQQQKQQQQQLKQKQEFQQQEKSLQNKKNSNIQQKQQTSNGNLDINENYQIYEQIFIKAQSGSEINKHEIDTLKSFLKTRSDRQNFINCLDQFFNNQKLQHVQQLKQQSNIHDIKPEEVEIQLSSDAYSQILKIIYTFFEMCSLNYDIQPIVQMYKITEKIFKLIELPDDQNGKEYEKICLQQGLQGNSIFSNIKYWQEYLKKFVAKVMSDYKKQEQSEFMDYQENNFLNQSTKETKFIENRLKIQLESLIQLNISTKNIEASLQPIYNMININETEILTHIKKVQEFLKQQKEKQLKEQQIKYQKEQEQYQEQLKKQQKQLEIEQEIQEKQQQQQNQNINQQVDFPTNNDKNSQQQEYSLQENKGEFFLQLEDNNIQNSDKDSQSNPKQSLDLQELQLDYEIPLNENTEKQQCILNSDKKQNNNYNDNYDNVIDINQDEHIIQQEKIPIQIDLNQENQEKQEQNQINNEDNNDTQQNQLEDQQIEQQLQQQELIEQTEKNNQEENQHISYKENQEDEKYSSCFE